MRRLTARRVRRSLGSIGIAFGFLSCPYPACSADQLAAGAQNLPPRDRPPTVSRPGTAVVRGRVVDAVTGKPLARSRVGLLGPPATRKSPVLTDDAGAFEITGVSAGPSSLMVEKSSYLPGRYPELVQSIRGRSQPFIVSEGQVIDNITVRMFHGGVIAGRVVDAYGDPLENAQIAVLRVTRSGNNPSPMNQVSTNDLGEYRVPRLDPGRYLIRVRPQTSSMMDMRASAAANDPPLPQPFPTYYPNSPSIEHAQPIVVGRGQTVTGVDLTLSDGVPTIVTGVVIRSDGEAIANGAVQARMIGTGTGGFDYAGGTGIGPGGVFRLTLPTGEYYLESQISPRPGPGGQSSNEQLSGMTRVIAGGGIVEGVTIVIGKGASATGRVIFEGSSPIPPVPSQTRVPFDGRPGMDGMGCRSQTPAVVAADWTFKIEGLVGTCGAPFSGLLGRWSLKSVILNGRNVADEMVTFESGQQYTDVQIIVTDKRTQLHVSVSGDDGQPTREYVALVFSSDKTRWTPPTRHVRTLSPMPIASLAGASLPPTANMSLQQERVNGLPVGEYFVIAVDDMTIEDAQDPAVLEKLANNAIRVTLTDEGPIEVPLRRFSFADVMR
jgi:hypothetical protein